MIAVPSTEDKSVTAISMHLHANYFHEQERG